MNKLKAYTLTVLLSTLTFAQESRAATIAPPLSAQVKQVTQWFTGFFDNAEQVASNSSVPFISMSNCGVQLVGANPVDETQNVYLEQKSVAFERISFYSFSPGNSAVNLSVRSFVNRDILRGLCNKPEQQRIVNISNIVAASCDLLLIWEPSRYTGTNAPNGCPTSSGGKVVSKVAISDSSIDALDQIFTAQGNLIVNTPIEFHRIKSIPEPDSTLGLLALGLWCIGSAVKRKPKQKSTQKEKASV